MAEEKDTKAKSGASGGSKGRSRKPTETKPAASKAATRPRASEPRGAAKPKAAAKAAAKPKAAAEPKETAKPKAEPKETAKPKAAAKARSTGSRAAAKPKEAPPRPVVRAKASYVRVAPRKARLVADQIRGLPIEEARTLLRFSPRSASRDIGKLIDSAAANAENNHDLVADDLRVSDITVDEGPTLRRYRPRALGRATRINKRTSHIRVALTPED